MAWLMNWESELEGELCDSSPPVSYPPTEAGESARKEEKNYTSKYQLGAKPIAHIILLVLHNTLERELLQLEGKRHVWRGLLGEVLLPWPIHHASGSGLLSLAGSEILLG